MAAAPAAATDAHAAVDDLDLPPLSTGIAGLDDVLRGGLTPGRFYLVEGEPGSGKTTLALQYLLAGVRRGEPTLYVTLSETKRELAGVARSHGWSLDGIHVHEMPSPVDTLSPDSQLTMFHPSELELGETTRAVLQEVERNRPRRVVVDSLSEMRLLAQNPLRYRRQILALKQFFVGRESTVLLLDDRTSSDDLQLQSIVHGVIHLEQLTTEFGSHRRRLSIRKMRGVGFRAGLHDFVIRRGGLDVFPRLVAADHHGEFPAENLASGVPTLDQLLGGGLPAGSSTLFMGPAGVGKSSVALQYALAAAGRGQRAALFLFDETIATLRARARGLGMPLDRHLESRLVTVRQIDPAELAPGEFACIVRRAVDGADDGAGPARVVLIDSLNGYLHSMAEEKFLTAQLHELFTYLNHRAVSTMVTLAQAGVVGTALHSPVDTTYLADNVILFRYFETTGRVRRAISVLKKRSGAHEATIRELAMGERGIEVGPPLEQFQGVLGGLPVFVGSAEDLLDAARGTSPAGPSPEGPSPAGPAAGAPHGR